MDLKVYIIPFLICCFGILVCCTFSYSSMSDLLQCFLNYIFENKPLDVFYKSIDKTNSNFASSVWCMKRLDNSKMCSFKNLYHHPQHKGHLLFFLNEFSVISGLESSADLRRINLSTINNHTGFLLKLVVIRSSEYLLQQKLLFLDDDTLILKRFKPDNIMHVIHDDLLPLFVTYQELCKGNTNLCLSMYQLLFLDDNDEGPYYEWYRYFSIFKPILLFKQDIIICIRKSTIGLSQESIWFQYGFKTVQGPLLNRQFNSLHLRRFVEFIKQKIGIKTEDMWPLSTKNTESVVFLSRKLNRKILNEYTVEEQINKMYQTILKKSVNVINVDLSINSSKEIITSLQKSNLFVGMHGSAMILALFLKEGANIIELFPFGIQPVFVSPLKTLCAFPNVFYNYNSWVNTNESNTRAHPEYPPLHGGLLHLPIKDQEIILNIKTVPPVECCHNQVYLFRMFQDTLVDRSFYVLLHEVITKHMSVLSEQQLQEKAEKHLFDNWYFPSPVFNLHCECLYNKINVSWHYPFNTSKKVLFSIATSTSLHFITDLTYFILEEECNTNQNLNLEKSLLSVWVKTMEDGKESMDSYTQCSF